jgi:hypothetical protein
MEAVRTFGLNMKPALCMLMVFCFLAQSASRLAWGVYYQYNKAEFARKCENRDKPALRCEGKCQLCKVLSPPSKSQTPSVPAGLSQAKDLQVFLEPLVRFELAAAPFLRLPDVPEFRFSLPESPVSGLFKPPSIQV